MVSELIIAKTTGKPAFGISRGIRDDKGALLGIVFAAVIPEKLDARLAVERSKGGGFAIVDNKGMLVYRYPAIKATWEERNWLKLYPNLKKYSREKKLPTQLYAPFEGKTPVGRLHTCFLHRLGRDVPGKKGRGRNQADYRLHCQERLLFLFVSLAAFFIALAVSRKITNPVTALHAHALALGHGRGA